jgi:hypothetical protein
MSAVSSFDCLMLLMIRNNGQVLFFVGNLDGGYLSCGINLLYRI